MGINRHFNLQLNSSDTHTKNDVIQFFRDHHILLIIIFAILIRLPLVVIPEYYGFQGSGWRQTDTASIAHNFVDSNFDLFNPQIHWGGNGPGYVETEFQLYPFIVSLFYAVFGEYIAIGLAVSLLFSLGTMLSLYALARRLFSEKAATLALIFFVISPLFIRYSVAFMPEPAVMFFYMTGLYLFVRWLDTPKLSWLLLAGASTALAILVKPTSIHLGFVILALVMEKYGWRFIRNPHLWLFALISLLPGVLWYLHARNLYLTYGNTFGIISGGDSKFDNLTYWTSPGFYFSILETDFANVVAVGGVIPFLIGLWMGLRNRRYRLIVYGVVAVGIYYMLIPRYTSFADYYHIFMVPFAALAVGLGFEWMIGNVNLTTRLWSYRSLATVAIVLSILVVSFRDYFIDVIPEEGYLMECGYRVAQVVPEDSLIIVSTLSASEYDGVANNYQEPNVFFYSHRYGWSLPADRHTPEHLATYREEGGQYFVIYDQELYNANPSLVSYLDQNAEQVGPGVADGCGIYRLNSN